ncbi:sulfite exporter TauE/SafE family protein [Daejeonella sp.]|uniref:sulfite exporter TauE/SafE family protein n=1 Tax=Daejeonella sp. TaxID=2805397 RepID=UPI0030C639F9
MTSELIIIVVAFLIAGWVQGIFGFGFAIATTLLLVNTVDFTTLVFLNLCMSVVTSLIAMLSGKNLKTINKNTLLKLIISSSAGLILGMAIITYVDAAILKKITLVVILLASIASLTKSQALFAHPYMGWIGGFFSGVLTPSTGINGPLVALHLNAAFTDKQEIRNTMLAYLFFIMTFGVISMSIKANLSSETTNMLVKVILPSILGYVIGMFSFRLLSDVIFKRTVNAFLICSSFASLVYLII